MKNSFYFRSICGVLSLATVMHSLSNTKQVVQPNYELSCKTKTIVAIANSKKLTLPCATKVSVLKEVNDNWSLVEANNKQYLVQVKNIREVESYASSKP